MHAWPSCPFFVIPVVVVVIRVGGWGEGGGAIAVLVIPPSSALVSVHYTTETKTSAAPLTGTSWPAVISKKRKQPKKTPGFSPLAPSPTLKTTFSP